MGCEEEEGSFIMKKETRMKRRRKEMMLFVWGAAVSCDNREKEDGIMCVYIEKREI